MHFPVAAAVEFPAAHPMHFPAAAAVEVPAAHPMHFPTAAPAADKDKKMLISGKGIIQGNPGVLSKQPFTPYILIIVKPFQEFYLLYIGVLRPKHQQSFWIAQYICILVVYIFVRATMCIQIPQCS
jgi:hypothetical protein